jgi:hypothetical protein
MSATAHPYPVAVSRLIKGETSREPQNARAIKWILDQPGGPLLVVTPRKSVSSEALKRLVARPGTTHLSWRGFSTSSLAGRRVVFAWPDRKHLNDLWDTHADALVIIEWGEEETAEWIEDAAPVQLLPGSTVYPDLRKSNVGTSLPLPADVEEILTSVAHMAAGYSSGLKWNEEDKLKADMMRRPERWAAVTVDQVRAKCRELKMRPKDVETIAGFLQRRKEGRRFRVNSSYRDFQFN